MNLALQVTGQQPTATPGLLPDFAGELDVAAAAAVEEAPLAESVQRERLAAREAVAADFKLTLDPAGVWLRGSTWPEPQDMRRMLALCEKLIGI